MTDYKEKEGREGAREVERERERERERGRGRIHLLSVNKWSQLPEFIHIYFAWRILDTFRGGFFIISL